MYFLLNMEEVLDYINEFAKGKRPNRISCEFINGLELDIPSIEQQKNIVDKMEKIRREKLKIEEQLKIYVQSIIK